MKKKIAKQLRRRQRKIRQRLGQRSMPEEAEPMLKPGNIHYEISDRRQGMLYGGIGAMQQPVQRLGLDGAINQHLHFSKNTAKSNRERL